MRLLLDESLPVDLADLIVGHEVTTARAMHWLGVKNGQLLALAASEGLDVFVTADKNLQFHQNLSNSLWLSFVRARTASRSLHGSCPTSLQPFKTVEPRTLRHVGA